VASWSEWMAIQHKCSIFSSRALLSREATIDVGDNGQSREGRHHQAIHPGHSGAPVEA
jgi:hypothetical protein